MKKLHIPSFLTGIGTGVVVLLIFFGGKALFLSEEVPPQARSLTGENTDRTARMAERFGMTPEELQAELDKGKTMQDIASEKGVEFGGGRRGGGMPPADSQ